MGNMDRRRLLRMGGAFSLLGTGAPFALQLAAAGAAAGAGTAPDYKALVCVFLYGGNDANNMVLATDSDSWGRYLSARNTGTDPIALTAVGTAPTAGAKLTTPQAWGGVIPITPNKAQPVPPGTNATTRTFGLHPFMTGAQGLFNNGRMAIMANVGTLIAPVTKAQYVAKTVPLPVNLYSHNDQQSEWQAGASEGARIGWGGQMADFVASQNGSNTIFTAITPSGNAVFLAGQNVVQYVTTTAAAPALVINSAQGTSLFGSSVAPSNVSALVQDTSGTSDFASDYATIVNRSITSAAAINSAFATSIATGIAPPADLHQPSDRQYGDQQPGRPASHRGPNGGRRPWPWRQAPGVLRQHGRVRHPSEPEHDPARPAAPDFRGAYLFRWRVDQCRRHRSQ